MDRGFGPWILLLTSLDKVYRPSHLLAYAGSVPLLNEISCHCMLSTKVGHPVKRTVALLHH